MFIFNKRLYSRDDALIEVNISRAYILCFCESLIIEPRFPLFSLDDHTRKIIFILMKGQMVTSHKIKNTS